MNFTVEESGSFEQSLNKILQFVGKRIFKKLFL